MLKENTQVSMTLKLETEKTYLKMSFFTTTPSALTSTHLHLFMDSEKAMAPHSSTLAWKIPGMEKPGRLQSMGSRRVGHD